MRRQFHRTRKARRATLLEKTVVDPLQIERATGQHGKEHGERTE